MTVYTVITERGLNLRETPTMDGRIIKTLKPGEVIKAGGAKAPAGWLSVEGGFVRAEYVR